MVRRKNKITHFELQYLENGKVSDDAFNVCMKRDNHHKYFHIKDLDSKLPFQDKELSNFIKIRSDLTGLIEMPKENGIYCGTGLIQKIEKFPNNQCPCPDCGCCGKEGWGKVTISTALHVIRQEEDGYGLTFRLFYDSQNCGDKEKILHGLKSHSYDREGDWCALVCVTHDLDLLDMLEEKLEQHWKLGHSLMERYQDTEHNLVVVVSHPHGGPKQLSIGKGKLKIAARDVRDDQDWCYYSYDAATCDGSSGAPIYVLGKWNDGFGYWFGHAHNHSGVDNSGDNSSTVGVDSIFYQHTQQNSSTFQPDTQQNGSTFQPDTQQNDSFLQPDIQQNDSILNPDTQQNGSTFQPDTQQNDSFLQPNIEQNDSILNPDTQQNSSTFQPDTQQNDSFLQPDIQQNDSILKSDTQQNGSTFLKNIQQHGSKNELIHNMPHKNSNTDVISAIQPKLQLNKISDLDIKGSLGTKSAVGCSEAIKMFIRNLHACLCNVFKEGQHSVLKDCGTDGKSAS